ncbi:MAG: serine hydrolase, partial [Planctomycetota bacterium]
PPFDYTYNAAGGHYLSTTDDLARLGLALLDGSLLDAETLDTLMVSQATRDARPTGWSHGWFVITDGAEPELRINGSNPGSWSHLRVYPESGLVIAMGTNTWGRTARERPSGLMALMNEVHSIVSEPG